MGVGESYQPWELCGRRTRKGGRKDCLGSDREGAEGGEGKGGEGREGGEGGREGRELPGVAD